MPASFADRLIAWQRLHGRHTLPWQGTRDPYAIWLSEIMLQQTQVATVIPYYERFRARFPDIATLAAADEDEVLRLWSGLGYYSRARNLQSAARQIMARHGGRFPVNIEDIVALPGIGRSTAAAVAAFAYGTRAAILDGNVKRVLTRHFGIDGYPGHRVVEQRLWALAEALLPERDIATYVQASMDLGATVCTSRNPACAQCPLRDSCIALAQNRVHELPTRRPRRAIPTRRTQMGVLLHENNVLLEKRPSSGIWGGLWSLPEFGVEEDAGVLAHIQGCSEVRRLVRLPALRHGFTHFQLEISPVLIEVSRRTSRAAEEEAVWLPLREAPQAAVPAPVRQILLSLSDSAGEQTALFEETVQDL